MNDTTITQAFNRLLEDPAKCKEFFDSLKKPNPLLEAMHPCPTRLKWFRRFAPKFVPTFVERQRRMMPIQHGYTVRHPLEFLYRLACKFKRKPKFSKSYQPESIKCSYTLKGGF
jgi:hypothetical protein